jgi:succinoglycan biosynthesis protein ExoW
MTALVGDPVRIAVVIPYFQREAGLLQRALRSVADQERAPVQVVVVDDGSPRSAADEITPELSAALPRLTVIRQPNRGVAASRNAALDALAGDVSAVALLDSDDYWVSSHLRYAAAAMTLGADFFFSNSRVEGQTADAFREHPRQRLLLSSERIQSEPQLMRWSHAVSALFGEGCAFRTSTVVFRRAVLPGVRFQAKLRCAGEDHLVFWALLVRSSCILYCSEPTAVYGRSGLGTWQNSTYGSVAHLVRLADEIRVRRHVLKTYAVEAADRQLMHRGIAERRTFALASALHLIRRRKKGVLSCGLVRQAAEAPVEETPCRPPGDRLSALLTSMPGTSSGGYAVARR